MAKTKQPAQPAKAWALFDKSRQLVSRHIALFALLYIVPLLGSVGSSIDSWHRHGQNKGLVLGDWKPTGAPTLSWKGWTSVAGLLILFAIISIIVQMLIASASYLAAKDRSPSFHKAWELTKKFGWRLLGVYILTSLAVLGGLILLIVPGLIFLRRYYLAPYVLLDQDVSIIEAMKRSSALSKPYSGSVWRIIGLSLLIALPNMIPVIGPIISIILAMYFTAVPALRYLELKKLS